MNELKKIKDFLDNNPDIRFIIKHSDNFENLPRVNMNFGFIPKIGIKININGDNLFDQLDQNIETLLSAAKSALG